MIAIPSSVERKIKCRPKGSGGVTTKMPPDIQEKYDELQKEHARLVNAAQDTADESLSKSEELTRQALDVEKDIEQLKMQYRFEFPGEEVCEICGVRYALQAEDKLEWHDRAAHLNGKMHNGWTQIREKLEELRKKERAWEKRRYQRDLEKERDQKRGKRRDRSREKRRSSDSDRSQDQERSRDRDKEHKKKPREKHNEKTQNRDRDKHKDRDQRKTKERTRDKEKQRSKSEKRKGKE